jgi:hypothetical protein
MKSCTFVWTAATDLSEVPIKCLPVPVFGALQKQTGRSADGGISSDAVPADYSIA